MKKLAFVALCLVGCGGVAQDDGQVASAVVSSDVYYTPVPYSDVGLNATVYGCGSTGTWRFRTWINQGHRTGVTGQNVVNVTMDSYPIIDLSMNEITFQCPTKTFTDLGTYLRSGSDTCQAYSHFAGYGWSWSEQIVLDSIEYFPISQFPTRGRWKFNFTPTSNVGLIGTGYGLTACIPGGTHAYFLGT